MNYKVVVVEVFAILVATLLFNLPLVAATEINIMFNGVEQAETTYETEDFVNHEIDFIHDPSDILWKNVKVAVRVNSASLAKEIKKIYLYKCKTLSPTNCIQSEPQTFDNFIDVELLWSDISEREGASTYPQVANLLVMIKLEDITGSVSWIGLWNQIRRTGYNIFTEYSHELSELDLHANTLAMVQPIKMYIDYYGIIPFNWITRAVFKNANLLYALGADENEIETSPPSFLTATPPTNEVTTINKDFYFIFSNTSSGVTNPLILNLNPTFTCGDGVCESNLGEIPGTCCYDCPCGAGQYCDVAPGSTAGQCRDLNQVSLQVVSASPPQVTDCSATFDVGINLRINNPPASLPSEIFPTFRLNETVYPATCSGGPPDYSCSITLTPGIECWQGSYTIGPNDVTTDITYTDGPNDMSMTLSTGFSLITVSYDCSCDDGFYCDTGSITCESEDAITLGITSLTDYLDDYDEGDTIDLTAKIFNPPTGTTLVSASATLNLTGGQVSPGSPTCTGPNTDYEYECYIPFQITGYSESSSYTFNPNTLTFEITYQDGSVDKIKTLETNFGPVSIPSQYCRDGVCNMGETSETCCIDCDCTGDDDYCDALNGCRPISEITISADLVNQIELTDCSIPHLVDITLTVPNPPSTLTLDYYYHITEGLPSGWSLQCDESGYREIFYCYLTVPAIEDCSPSGHDIDNNELNLSISFDDGVLTSPFYSRITRQVSVGLPDITITPIYHCGDGECESDLNENPDNCCLDCPCDEEYYCDAGPSNPNGVCRPSEEITLVIDSPRNTVRLTSCEISKNVNIKAHIENQPSEMQSEYYYGTLNGSSAELLHCDAEQLYGTSNVTFNCTLAVPSQFMCEQGETYKYKDNSISIFISYMNGEVTETKTLSEPLPDIVVTQSIRSIYDIMQEAQTKMNESLSEVQKTARKMFDAYEKCTKWVMVAAIIVTLATVAGMVWGGIKTITKKWEARDFGDLVGTIGQSGSALIQMLANICQLIANKYQIGLTAQKIEMDMVSMQLCMETNQHMLDIGQCRGREESCFSNLINCVNFGNVNSWMNQINSVMQQVRQTSQSIGSSYSRFWFGQGGSGAGVYGIFGGGPSSQRSSFQVQVYYGNDLVTIGPFCSRDPNGGCIAGRIKVVRVGGYCSYPVVQMVMDGGSSPINLNTLYNIEGNVIPANAEPGTTYDVTFKFYCSDVYEDRVTQKFMRADSDCLCPGISSGTGNKPEIVSFTADKPGADVGEEINFEYVIKGTDTIYHKLDFGDGSAPALGDTSGFPCGDGCSLYSTHIYSAQEQYAAKLEASYDSSYPTDRTSVEELTVTVLTG